MALTAAQKVSIRRHLGLNSAAAANYPFVDTFHAVDKILTTLDAAAEAEAAAILDRLTNLETSLDDALKRLKASALGSIKLNGDEIRQRRAELHRWRVELSTLLGVPLQRGTGQIVVT